MNVFSPNTPTSPGPRRPDSQGHQGQTAQPNQGSYMQAAQGAQAHGDTTGHLTPPPSSSSPGARTAQGGVPLPGAGGGGPAPMSADFASGGMSPVTSNGMIPPAGAAVPMSAGGMMPARAGAPAPAPQAAPGGAATLPYQQMQPATQAAPDPNTWLPPGGQDMGNGLVRFPNGQILPRNHPAFLQAMQQATPAPAPSPTPAPPAPTRAGGAPAPSPGQPTAPGGAATLPYQPMPTPGQADTTPTPLTPPAQPGPAPAPTPGQGDTTPYTPLPDPNTWVPQGGQDLGNGMVRFPDGQVLPRNHPAFQQRMAQMTGGGAKGGPGATPTPGSAPAPGAPRPPGTNPTELLNQPAPTYQAQQVLPFGQQYASVYNPTNQYTQNLSNNLMGELLRNPYSMTPQAVGMLEAQQRETALAQQRAMMEAIGQRQAASGFDVPGGTQMALQARAGHQTQANLLQGQRDIQLAKMERDRQDALNVLGMANQHMNSEVNRNIGAYGAYLQGQGQNAGELFRAYGSQTDAFNQHNDTALRAQQLALQNTLGQGGLNLQQQQLAQNASQFGQNYQLSQAALMNDMIMGRANHGLNLAQLQQMAQNGMFNTIFGGR